MKKTDTTKPQCQGTVYSPGRSWGASAVRCTRSAGPGGFCAQHAPKVADASKGVLYVVGVDKPPMEHKRGFVEAAIPVVSRGPKTTTVERTTVLGHRERIDFGDASVVNLANDWDTMGARFASYDRAEALGALREHIRAKIEDARRLAAEWEIMLKMLPKETP